MLPTGALAVAIGIGFLVLLVIVSFRGPRGRARRLRGNGGPIIPYHDDFSHGA